MRAANCGFTGEILKLRLILSTKRLPKKYVSQGDFLSIFLSCVKLSGRNEVCEIRDQRGGIRDQKGSGITALVSGITDHGVGISRCFLGIRDQAVPYLWDQGQKLVTLLESRIRNLRTNGSSDENRTSLPP